MATVIFLPSLDSLSSPVLQGRGLESLAQLVKHRSFKPGVVGSKPTGFIGALAQWQSTAFVGTQVRILQAPLDAN